MKAFFSIFLGLMVVGCGKDSESTDQSKNRADGQKGSSKESSANNTGKENTNTEPKKPAEKSNPESSIRLPEAGAWVLHKMVINVVSKDDKGEEKEAKVSGSFKVSSLGSKVIKGKRCRGVEIELKIQLDKLDFVLESQREQSKKKFADFTKNNPFIINFMFDEKALQTNENPLQSLVFMKMAMLGEVGEVPLALLGSQGIVPAPDSRDKAKNLEVKVIKTKLGDLECSGDIRGVDFPFVSPTNQSGDKSALSLEVWRNDSVPFGMVSTLATLKATLKGLPGETQATMSLIVQEVGKGAVSQMPKPE